MDQDRPSTQNSHCRRALRAKRPSTSARTKRLLASTCLDLPSLGTQAQVPRLPSRMKTLFGVHAQVSFFCKKWGQKWTLFWSPKLAPFWPTYEPHIKMLIGCANIPILGAKNRSHFGTQIWPPNSSFFLAQNGHSLAPKSNLFWF